MSEKEIVLRYGFNPHQKPARIYSKKGTLPFRVLNGAPGVYQYAGCSQLLATGQGVETGPENAGGGFI